MLRERKVSGNETVVVQELDLNSFSDNKELISPYLDKRVFASLTTATFSDLEAFYRMRKSGTLPPNFEKPIYGQILEFGDLQHFNLSIATGSYPNEFIIGQEYTGMSARDGELFVCNGSNVEVFKGGKRRILSNRLFNDLHFVDFSRKGDSILVCSSGIDALLEFSYPEMDLQWSWLAPEFGYTHAPDGTTVVTQKMIDSNSFSESLENLRIIDIRRDYSREQVETTQQTAHLNTATYIDDVGNLIGTTIFQTGEALMINKDTNEVTRVLDGLKEPHGFFRFGSNADHYVVTSARLGLVDILDSKLNHVFRIKGEVRRLESPHTWIQNTFPVGDNLLALVDHCQRRTIFFDPFVRERYIVENPNEWKIFQLYFSDFKQSALTIK